MHNRDYKTIVNAKCSFLVKAPFERFCYTSANIQETHVRNTLFVNLVLDTILKDVVLVK